MKRDAWVVVAEWPNDEPCTLAVFVGKTAPIKAGRYAEEMRHEYATGKYIPGKKYIVYGYGENVEEYEEDWEVSINVDRVDLNPRIPDSYTRMMRRKAKKEGAPAK